MGLSQHLHTVVRWRGQRYDCRLTAMNRSNVHTNRTFIVRLLCAGVVGVFPAVVQAASFSPVDGASNVDPDVILTWSDYGPANSYDVYFSTDYDEVANGLNPVAHPAANQDSGSHDPYGIYSLNKDRTYYWRVDRVDGDDVYEGDVLDFRTVSYVSVYSRKSVMLMPMRDGVGIYTELYMPLGMGPFPTIFFKTTYGPEVSQGAFDAGYYQVVQTQRGRGGSEGQGFCFISDVDDSYDAVEWISAQPWSNGKIGGQGVSGPGIVQEMAAASGTDDITCQWVGLSTGNIYETVFQGGAYREALCNGWFSAVGYDVDYHKQQIEAHPDYDDFWKPANLADPDVYTQVTMPALRLSGWYDCFSNGAIEGFTNIQHHGAGNAAGNQYLIMGPWIHGITNQIGELTFPPSCTNPPASMNSGPWNDYWLKGIQNEVTNQPHVIYWVMGDPGDTRSGTDWNLWRTAEDWPPEATVKPYYLTQADGLSTEMDDTDESSSFVFDPDNPVPTLGGNNYVFVGTNGPYDQRPIENRSDVLVFTSEPLPRPLEVTGRIKARLYVSSSCVDTDFTVKLTDVYPYPDERSMLIADGIIRTRYRESPSYRVLMTPGEVYEVEVDLWSTSMVFNAGHRIRVAISSSNHPRFDVNPNTGQPWDPDWRESQTPIVATNTIHTGPTYPSSILLPVIEKIVGDFDGDGDADQSDFAHIQACLTGSGDPVTDPDCHDCRLDRDVDVDQDDLQIFIDCMSGADVPADPDCGV